MNNRIVGKTKGLGVGTRDRRKADRGSGREAKRTNQSPRRESKSDLDTFDASVEATTRDNADKQEHRRSKKPRTPETHTSRTASKYRKPKAVSQSAANVPSTHRGKRLSTIEEESPRTDSRSKPVDNQHPTLQTASPREEPALGSSMVSQTEPDQEQPVHEDVCPSHREDCCAESSTVQPTEPDEPKPVHEDVCPSHREDCCAESSTVQPTEADQILPVHGNNNKSSLIEEHARETLEALPTTVEPNMLVLEDVCPSPREDCDAESSAVQPTEVDQQQPVDGDVCPSSREDYHAESSTVMPTEAEQQQTVREDAYPSPREDVPLEPSTVMPTEAEQQQPVHDACPSHREDCHAESSTVMPVGAEQQQPVHDACPSHREDCHAESSTVQTAEVDPRQPVRDNDQSSFLIEELALKLSLSDGLSTEERQHRPLPKVPRVRYVHLHVYEEACPSPADDPAHESPEYESGEGEGDAECVTPEPTIRYPSLHNNPPPGSPEYIPGETVCVTPEPTIRFSRRHNTDPIPGTRESTPDEAEYVTPEPTIRYPRLQDDPAPESPEYTPDESECVTPEPTIRYPRLHRDPVPESPEYVPGEAECVTPEPTRRYPSLHRDPPSVPESPEAAPADTESVIQGRRRNYQLSPIDCPEHESPEYTPDEAECVTPEPTIKYSSLLHRDPFSVPESPEAVPAEAECVTPVRHNSQSSLIDDPVPQSPEAVPAEAECVTPVRHNSQSSLIDDSVPQSPEAVPTEAECKSPVHEDVDPGPVDRPVHMSPSCELAALVEEETPMTYEDYLIMLGKRPVHESADAPPFDAERRSPVHQGSSSLRETHVHESSGALSGGAVQRSPAHGNDRPSLRAPFLPGSSSSSYVLGRNVPVDPMAPSGSGEPSEVQPLAPTSSNIPHWTNHPSNLVNDGEDEDLMSNLVAFSMFEEDGQVDPQDFIRQQTLLLDAYKNARDLNDHRQPLGNASQVTHPNVLQAPHPNIPQESHPDITEAPQSNVPQEPPSIEWNGKILFRNCELTNVVGECPISLPSELKVEARVPMTSLFRMTENPEMQKIEHYCFYITPAQKPNRLFSKLSSHLAERQAAGVVHLREFNITLYLVPALESSCAELGTIEDRANALVCFLIVM